MEWDVYNEHCHTRIVLDRIADKWTLLIVGALEDKTKRFGELRWEIGGVSQKMLSQTLRGLEREGLVAPKVYASVPTKVEYSLTDLGRTVVSVYVECALTGLPARGYAVHAANGKQPGMGSFFAWKTG
jgi:DNA-binding HxlR family transcriptional regulator